MADKAPVESTITEVQPSSQGNNSMEQRHGSAPRIQDAELPAGEVKPVNTSGVEEPTSQPPSTSTVAPSGSSAVASAPAPKLLSSQVHKYKFVFVGDQSVGKTSIITRFMYDSFDKQYQSTIGIDFLSKTLYLDDRTVRLQLWDTAGQERFRSLIPAYIRDSAAAVVVYDITSHQSFVSTFQWVEQVRKERGNEALIALVGNKMDLAENREVGVEEAQKKAKELDALFFEVSARTGEGVEMLFRSLARAIPSVIIQQRKEDGTRKNVITVERMKKAQESTGTGGQGATNAGGCAC